MAPNSSLNLQQEVKNLKKLTADVGFKAHGCFYGVILVLFDHLSVLSLIISWKCFHSLLGFLKSDRKISLRVKIWEFQDVFTSLKFLLLLRKIQKSEFNLNSLQFSIERWFLHLNCSVWLKLNTEIISDPITDIHLLLCFYVWI